MCTESILRESYGPSGVNLRPHRVLVCTLDGSGRMRAGDLFAIGPGHESEIIGDDNYVSLHLTGVEEYLKTM
jgi:hypothetical protein